jgi:hypothetical protein
VNAVLLKPLSYHDPDRIVTLTNYSTVREGSTGLSKQISIPDVLDWQRQSTSFEAMAYYNSRELSVVRGSVAEYARVAAVSLDLPRLRRGAVHRPVLHAYPDSNKGRRVAVTRMREQMVGNVRSTLSRGTPARKNLHGPLDFDDALPLIRQS